MSLSARTRLGVVSALGAMVFLLLLVTGMPLAQAGHPGGNGRIAHGVDSDGIYLVDADGSDSTLLVPGPMRLPDFSPDGTRLVVNEYLNTPSGTGALRIVDVETGAMSTFVESDAVEAAWSGGGSRIAYTRETGTFERSVWVKNVDGSGDAEVTADATAVYDWSPVDDRILVVPATGGLATLDVDTLDQIPINGGNIFDGDFSPDGQKVAFVIGDGAAAGLYVSDADGTNRRTIDTSTAEKLQAYRYVAWSPDGTKLVADRLLFDETFNIIGVELVVIDVASGAHLDTIPGGGNADWQPLPGEGPRFTDVPADSVFADDIDWLADQGITRGCNPPTNSMFCPDDFVSRAQMAAFLVRALGYVDDGGGDLFVDDDGSVFEGDIERLATAGVTRGCNPPTNDRFCPDDFVSRGQMAAFLVRAQGYVDDGGGDLFVDDDGSVFEGDIERLATAGVTRGCNPPTNDRFCPDDFVTRAQMAAFLHRALG